MERKRAERSEQLSYYIEQKFSKSPVLKSMDPHRQELPIGYAKNCTRRLSYYDGTVDMNGALAFGKIHMNAKKVSMVNDNLQMYRILVLLDLMKDVYDEDGAGLKGDADEADALAFLEAHPDYVADLLRRFYPSDANWMDSRSGEGFNNGRILDPVQHSAAINQVKSNAAIRDWVFNQPHKGNFTEQYKEFLQRKELDPAFKMVM